jgi:hypothetical protein
MLKYLRIAVTALSLTACVLLIALWVRSHFCADLVGLGVPIEKGRQMNVITTFPGLLLTSSEPQYEKAPRFYCLYRHSAETWPLQSRSLSPIFKVVDYNSLAIRFWFLVAVTGAIAGVAWYKPKISFSLRTLLIATTLVAVGMGAVVFLAR